MRQIIFLINWRDCGYAKNTAALLPGGHSTSRPSATCCRSNRASTAVRYRIADIHGRHFVEIGRLAGLGPTVIGRPSVSVGGFLAGYDFELPLRDALADPDLDDPVRSALASIAIGTGLDDGHLAAAELAGAARQFAADRAAGVSDEAGEGARQLRCVLTADCDDYQRGLWYAVSRCSADVAAEHLAWLVELMHARASMFRAIRSSGAWMPLLPAGASGETAQLRVR